MRHAAIEFRSEHYLTIDGSCADVLWRSAVRRLPHRRRTFRAAAHDFSAPPGKRPRVPRLRADARRPSRQALQKWEAVAFETEAYQHGCVVAAMRSPDEWARHPHAAAVAAMPPVSIEKIGDAPARPLPQGPRPLSGLRVLDLTRIIAGPVAGRALAAHGADVMRISAPGLPFIDWLVKDTGRGKLSAYADIATPDGRAALQRLIKDADIFLQAFRPGALGVARVWVFRRGRAPSRDRVRLVVGLWRRRTMGGAPWLQLAGADRDRLQLRRSAAAGVEGPKELPCQALDHASGYLLAFGAIMARLRQAQRRRQLAGARLAGGDRAMALESGSRRRRCSRARFRRAPRWRICSRTARRRSVQCAPCGTPRSLRRRPRDGFGRRCRSARTRRSGLMLTGPKIYGPKSSGRSSIGVPCGVRADARCQASRVRASVSASARPLAATRRSSAASQCR